MAPESGSESGGLRFFQFNRRLSGNNDAILNREITRFFLSSGECLRLMAQLVITTPEIARSRQLVSLLLAEGVDGHQFARPKLIVAKEAGLAVCRQALFVQMIRLTADEGIVRHGGRTMVYVDDRANVTGPLEGRQAAGTSPQAEVAAINTGVYIENRSAEGTVVGANWYANEAPPSTGRQEARVYQLHPKAN